LTLFVLDASVAVASVQTTSTAYGAARACIARILVGTDAIVVPAIFEVEVTAALARGGVAALDVARFAGPLLANARVVTVGPRFARAAARLASTASLRGMDAIYVTVASREGVDVVTLDRDVLSRASRVGVTARAP
jgi:predicted nucleic acid-binding protein